jgi:hypothetical protein
MEELLEVGSTNLCKKRFIAEYKKLIKIGNQTINICKPNFSQNITMTRTGKVTIKLTDSIHLPPEFEKLAKVNNPIIHDIFKLKVGKKKT